MKTIRAAVRALVLLLLFSGAAQATAFYSSSTGSDIGNNCQTLVTPCNLANGFANEMAQVTSAHGDILYMCAGACDGAGSASITANFDGQSGYTIPAGSSFGNALIVQPYPGETITLLGFSCFCDHEKYVILQGFAINGTGLSSGNQADVLINGPNADHIELQNMDVTAGLVARSGIIAGNATSGNLFINVHSHHNGNSALYHGIYIENCDNCSVIGGEYNNNASAGVQTFFGSGHPLNALVQGVVSHDNVTGCFCDGTNSTYINNIFYTNSQRGMTSNFGAASGNLLANNTIFNWDTSAQGWEGIFIGSSTTLVKNNILWGSATGANISGGTASTNLCTSGCLVSSDPLFISSSTHNFRIQTNSPAASSGANLTGNFTVDADNASRPAIGPWSIGAYNIIPPCTGGCLVQFAKTANSGTGATLNVPFTATQVSAHLNVLKVTVCPDTSCSISSAGYTCSATDDHSNTYSLVDANTGTTGLVLCFLTAKNITGGTNTVHVTVTGASNKFYLTGYVEEWSGMDLTSPLDRSGKANGTSTTPSASTSLATTHASDIVFGLTANLNQGEVPGAGFIQVSDARNEYKTVNATGTQTANWTSANGAWAADVVALKTATTPTSIVPLATNSYRRRRQ